MAENTRPDIQLSLSDHVFSEFGAYGGAARTPRIDALADVGAMVVPYRSSSRWQAQPSDADDRRRQPPGWNLHAGADGVARTLRGARLREDPKQGEETIDSPLSAAGYGTFVTGERWIGARSYAAKEH